jgi:hypothetical protein
MVGGEQKNESKGKMYEVQSSKYEQGGTICLPDGKRGLFT